jgi:hypothetical protein
LGKRRRGREEEGRERRRDDAVVETLEGLLIGSDAVEVEV